MGDTAERLVGLSFSAVGALAAAGAVWALAVEHAPAAKPLDIAVAAPTLAAMPPVGLMIMRLGEEFESQAAPAEGYQTVLDGLLAGALLIGLVGERGRRPVVGRSGRRAGHRRLRLARRAAPAPRPPGPGGERVTTPSPCW